MTWNVRGLNIPEKRSVVRKLHRLHAPICFLQETHFTASKGPSIRDESFPHVYHAPSPETKSKGVSTLIHKSVPWNLEEEWSDGTGRLLFTKGTIGTHTLVNLYSPSSPQITFLSGALEQLDKFAEGILLIGGDLNTVLNPVVDASSATSYLSFVKLNRLKKILFRHQLIDVWHFLHPKDRDFSFFSHVHSSYTRIDLLFVPHCYLDRVRKADIGSITISDYALVLMDTYILEIPRPPLQWRLIDSLLLEPEVVDNIKK